MSGSEGSFEMSDDEPLGIAESDPSTIDPPIEAPPAASILEEAKNEPSEPASASAQPPAIETEIVQQEEVVETPTSEKRKSLAGSGKKEGKQQMSLPVLNAATVNSMTYDLDQLLDPKLQRKLETDRLSSTHSLVSSDFVRMNKESAGRPATSRSRDEGTKGRPSYQDPVNVEERFYKYRKNVEDKVKLMEEELRKKEKELCTFAPSIKSKHSASTDGARPPDEFYKEMMKRKQDMDEKLKLMREESDKAQKSQEDAYFKPQLCAKSKAILEAKGEPDLPVHEKLYKAHKQSMQRQMKSTESMGTIEASSSAQALQDVSKPFTPAINRVSQNIVREKPIEQHLLEDAERRLKKLESAPSRPPPPKHLSSHSEQMLLRKFKEEFSAAWDALDPEKTAILNYTKSAELLKMMHFIENESDGKFFDAERTMIKTMWTMMQLTEDGAATKGNMETLLLAIMSFSVSESAARAEGKGESKTPEIASEAKPEGELEAKSMELEAKQEVMSEVSRAPGRMEDGVLVLGPGDCKRLHFQYRNWYDRRQAILKSLKSSKEEERYSFKPDLSKTSKKASEVLAQRKPESGKPEFHLFAELAKKQERQREMQEKVTKEKMKECVFHPKIDKRSAKMLAEVEEHKSQTLSADYMRILKETAPKPQEKTTALYNLASLSQQRRKNLEKTPEEMELEAQEFECTFAPDLKKTRNFVSGQGAFADPPKGVDKVIERMARARQEADEIKALRESGLSYRGKKEKKQTESKTEGPLVVLAVQVSGRAEELRVRPGDDLDALIGAFTAQHRLNSTEAQLVGEQLRNQYEQATGSASDD